MRLKARVEHLEKDLERYNHKLQTLSDFTNRNLLEFKKQQDEIEAKVGKHDLTIKEILDAIEPILIRECKESLNSVVGEFEKALQDLFDCEIPRKCQKGAKSSAEKCKKCGETQKGESKCSVAKKKSKK